MIESPTNIREHGRQVALEIEGAAKTLREALAESCTPPGRGRTNALLKAAAQHAEVVKKLDRAIEMMKEFYQ